MTTAKEKGDILEDLVADLYSTDPDFKIEKRKKLPTLIHEGQKRTKREVDILMTLSKNGLKFTRAIECKNYKNKIGVNKIADFIDKLRDVGLEVRGSIFVCINGYTLDAIQKAEREGIELLIFEDQTSDYIKSQVQEAIQKTLFLHIEVESISITTKIKEYEFKYLSGFLFSKDGEYVGLVNDIVYNLWTEDKLDLSLGINKKYVLEEEIIKSLYTYSKGKTSRIIRIEITYSVIGNVLRIKGKTNLFSLKNPNGNGGRVKIKSNFNVSNKKEELIRVESEDEFEKIGEKSKVVINHVVRLPRIVCNKVYWPPSKKSIQKLIKFEEQKKRGELGRIDFYSVEGSRIESAWQKPDPNFYALMKEFVEKIKQNESLGIGVERK